jgi:hypothetical protein
VSCVRQWAAWWGTVLLAIDPIHHCTEAGGSMWLAGLHVKNSGPEMRHELATAAERAIS